MRTPLLSKSSRRTQISNKKSHPPPVGGWNARDSYWGMGKSDAIELVNIFPDTTYCITRTGSARHATGTTGNIKTLGVFSGLTGSQSIFGATSTGIYNVSASGAVGASVLARTNGKHQVVNMGDGTNNWLMMFNGVDKPAYYNGTTWTAVDGASVPALTGVTTTGLVTGMEFKGRLILGEINTLKFWYLASGAVGGALTAFDLTAYASRGGYLMAMGTWTYDGGAGQDDRAVFVTSEGEVIVYEGTDPGVAANWARVGTYYFGKPIGRRCLCKYGGDLLVLTQNGIVELSKALTGVVNESKFQISDKIRQAFVAAANQYSEIFGWEALIYPKENALIVNVPQAEDGTHEQYVMNLTTKAWCKFTGWNAETFGIYNKNLYFAYTTRTMTAWDSTQISDDGLSIQGVGATSFTNFGIADKKSIKLIAPTLYGSGNTSMLVYTDYDFQSVYPGLPTFITFSGAHSRTWQMPSCQPCVAISVVIQFVTSSAKWLATDYIYEIGSGL